MKIVKIECFPVLIKYKRASVMGGRIIPGSEPVVVKIHTDEGIVGIAEAGHASLGYIGEGQDSVMGIINDLFGPKVLLGEDPLKVEKLTNQCYRMTKHNNAAVTVIDYCLYDIIGKKYGVPVYQLLGGLTTPKIPLGMVLTFGDPEFTVQKAKEIKAAGFKSLKLKHGGIDEDVANVKAVREALGDDFKIGIDINGGYDYFEALEALYKLEPYNLFMCEQPVPWWDIDGLARLRQKVRTPIAADESATELNHLLNIVQKNAADVLFIKLAKVGGITFAQKWAAIAQAANIPVMCGCLVGSGFEAAAQAHFLAANGWMGRMEHESNGPLHMHDIYNTVNPPLTGDLAKNPPRYEDGYLYPPDGPGLGVDLDEDVMKELLTPGRKPTMIELTK